MLTDTSSRSKPMTTATPATAKDSIKPIKYSICRPHGVLWGLSTGVENVMVGLRAHSE